MYNEVFNLPATNEAPGKHSIVVTEGPIFSEFHCTVGCGQNSHRLTKASGAQKHLVSYNHWLNCKRYCAPATIASQSDEELKRLYCDQVVPYNTQASSFKKMSTETKLKQNERAKRLRAEAKSMQNVVNIPLNCTQPSSAFTCIVWGSSYHSATSGSDHWRFASARG